MYTLMNQSKTLCIGIFPSAAEAQDWADSFLPALKLQPLELMLAEDTRHLIEAGDGWTWTKNSLQQCTTNLRLPVC